MIKFLNKPKLDITEIDISQLNEHYRSKGAGGYFSYKLPDSLSEKVHSIFDNKLHEHIEGIFIQIIRPEFNDHIHRDPRIYAINYLLESGGDNVETCFYDHLKTETEKYVFPVHTWNTIKVDGYHCVRNIVTERKAITISFKKYIDANLLLDIIS